MCQTIMVAVSSLKNSCKYPRPIFLGSHSVCFSEAETSISPARAELLQDEEGSSDEDSGCENSLDQGGIMDFSAAAVAEQLTRMDSVRERTYLIFYAFL